MQMLILKVTANVVVILGLSWNKQLKCSVFAPMQVVICIHTSTFVNILEM